MTALNRKLMRTIAATRGQFLALAVIVMLGVSIYIGMSTAYLNLSRSRTEFYREYGLADYFFHVVSAPETIVRRVEAVPGVVKATGRVQQDIAIIKPGGERAIGRLTGYPVPIHKDVHRLHVLKGRMFENTAQGPVEVLVDPGYAAANGLQPGDRISIIAGGKKADLILVGTAVSPEFVYPIRDAASLFPEPKQFGILMVNQVQAQQVLNMSGQVNQVLVQLAPGADADAVKHEVEKILKPYGYLASYPRKDQLSNAMLQAELDGLAINSRAMPLIFFLVAAGLQFVLLGRMIRSHKAEIGVMKALGCEDTAVIMLYTKYALLVSLAGAVIGTGFGILIASAMSDTYALFFNLPRTIGGLNGEAVLNSFLLSLGIGGVSGYLAARSVMRINPAEAMRSQAAVVGHHIPLESWKALWNRLSTGWRMSMRSVFRNRVRFFITVLGIASSVMLLMLAGFSNDATDYFMNQGYYQVNRYDYIVHMARPIKLGEILYWKRWDEVERLEPMLEVPVKMYKGSQVEDDVLIGLQVDSTLRRVVDSEGRRLRIPREGVLVNSRTARKLGIKLGDRIKVETQMTTGPVRTAYLRVVGINEQLMGAGSYVALQTANRVLQETGMISAVMLEVEENKGAVLEKRLRDMTGVSSILSSEKERQNMEELMASTAYFIAVMVLFAGLLGLAIVYNSSIMNFNERKRELASMKVLGYDQSEIAGLLTKETLLQALLGIAIGLPAGWALGAAYVASVNTDLFSMPVIIYPRTYAAAAAASLAFIAIGQFMANRRIKELNMVEVLKNQD